MLPIDFPGRNRILHGPRDENGNPTTDILDLPSFTNGQVCVCCWELTEQEKQQLRQTLGIYVFLWYGHIDPIYLSAICPFNYVGIIKVNPITPVLLYADEEKCITFWEFEDEEIELILSTGKFWFTIESGDTQPPVGFLVESPFIDNENSEAA